MDGFYNGAVSLIFYSSLIMYLTIFAVSPSLRFKFLLSEELYFILISTWRSENCNRFENTWWRHVLYNIHMLERFRTRKVFLRQSPIQTSPSQTFIASVFPQISVFTSLALYRHHKFEVHEVSIAIQVRDTAAMAKESRKMKRQNRKKTEKRGFDTKKGRLLNVHSSASLCL